MTRMPVGVLGGDPVDPFGDDADGVDVQAAIGLVQDGERRTEHGELENLGALLLSSGEPLIQIAAGELRIHAQFFHLIADLLAKLAHRDQVFALLAGGIADVGHGMAKEVGDRSRPGIEVGY